MHQFTLRTSYPEDEDMDPVGESYPHQGSLLTTQVESATEPPPHQPDKAPSEQEEKNDQQQQNGDDPPHPPHSPFIEPDVAPE